MHLYVCVCLFSDHACVFVCVCLCMHVHAYVHACIFYMLMLEPLLMSAFVLAFCKIAHTIFHPDVYFVCYIMLVQCLEAQDRRFTNFHYYYYKHSLACRHPQ